MKTPILLLCVALSGLAGCAANNWTRSTELPDPISCDPRGLEACEAHEIEADLQAPLELTEEIDAVNRGRTERCYLRHRAALACFCVLHAHGITQTAPATCGATLSRP